MATPTHVESSSSSSDGITTDGESSGSSEEEDDPSVSSWAMIYESIKEHQEEGEDINAASIFQFANCAILDGNPIYSVRLYAIALRQQHDQFQSHEGSHCHINLRLLCLALNRCITDEDKLSTKKREETFGSVLCLAVDDIMYYCDLLSLLDSDLLTSAGALYFRLEEYENACRLAVRALEMDPENLLVQENLENLCCHLVERWHFIMLNDRKRNIAYQQAVSTAVNQFAWKTVICDIGCGTGLLSLIACEQPKTSMVYAIEKSTVMCKIADTVFKANLDQSTTPKVQIISKLSTELSVPADIPTRADILVTETFDAGLFGEGILPTLCHAWSNLIRNDSDEKGCVIPSRAQLYMQVIESAYIYKENSYVGRMEGLDISKMHIYSKVGLCDSDPYSAHDLKQLPGGFTALSNPVPFMEVDFNKYEELLHLKNGFSQQVSTDIVKRGRMDAVVMWFSLHLNENVAISTHTDCNSCWEQAVFPICRLKVMEQPESQDLKVSLNVEVGDKVKVDQLVKGGKQCMAVTSISRGSESGSQYGLKDLPKFLSDPLEWCKHGVYCLNSWEILALNDTTLQSAILQRLVEIFSQITEAGRQTHLVHLNNGFSPLGLQAVQCGFHKTLSVADSDVQAALLKQIALENGIDWTKVTLVDDASGFAPIVAQQQENFFKSSKLVPNVSIFPKNAVSKHTLTSECPEPQNLQIHKHPREPHCRVLEVRENSGMENTQQILQSQEILGTPAGYRAVVVCDVVDHQGRLVERLSDHLNHMRKCLSMYSQCVVTPHSFDVYGVLVDSEQLLHLSSVQSDGNTLGFNIGSFINKFAVRNYQGITLDTLPHTKLSAPFKMFTVNVYNLVGGADYEKSASNSIPELTKQQHTINETSKNNEGRESPEHIAITTASSLSGFIENHEDKTLQTPEKQPLRTSGIDRKSKEVHDSEASLADQPIKKNENCPSVSAAKECDEIFYAHKYTMELPSSDFNNCLGTTVEAAQGNSDSIARTTQSAEAPDSVPNHLPDRSCGVDSQTVQLHTCGVCGTSMCEDGPVVCKCCAISQVKETHHLSSDSLQNKSTSLIALQSTATCEGQKKPGTSVLEMGHMFHERSENVGVKRPLQPFQLEDREICGDEAKRKKFEADVECPDPHVIGDGDLDQTVHLKVPIICGGNVTALVYWFELDWSPTCSMSTMDSDHHWQQAAVMTHPSQRQNLQQGDVLGLCCKLFNSAVSFSVHEKIEKN